MDNFIVSARKYRPATFDMVVGQDTITTTLKNAIKNNHLAQAYLFCGPRGVGKTTCARIFAKTINCINPNEGFEACDKCESCLSFNSQASFNIHELDAASNNSVDDIRNLTDQVRIPPQIGKFSVYIVDEVHMLSTQAFNAFLKTLEEPPSHAIFILATTEKHKIIPTILSRCQIFDFNRINVDDIVNRLVWVAGNEGAKAEHEALHVIATKADGALRDALSIFDQIVSFSGKNITYSDVIANLNVLDYEYYFKIVGAALARDVTSVLLTYNEILNKGFDGYNFMAGLNNHLRDLLVSRDEATVKLLETSPSIRQRYREQALQATLPFLYNSLEIGSQCMLNIKNSKNQRLHVELALLRLCQLTAETEEERAKKKVEPELNSAEAPGTIIQKENLLKEKAEVTQQKEKLSPSETVQTPAPVRPDPEIERKISIKSLMSDVRPSAGTVEEPAAGIEKVTPEKDFTIDDLLKSWNDYAMSLKDDSPRISITLQSVLPELMADRSILLKLDNSTLKESFDHSFKAKLEHHLRKTLLNSSITINTVVESTERGEILYSNDQKFNHLAAKNPALKDLRRTFNLEFE